MKCDILLSKGINKRKSLFISTGRHYCNH